jgi:hypothetical protein
MARKRRRRPRAAKPPPACKAILLCDAILVDPFSGKTSLCGLTERFVVAQFPGTTARFYAYLQLTNGIGKYKIAVEVQNVADANTVARGDIVEMTFRDRAAKVILVIPVPSLPLPRAGWYDFIVMADGQEIDRQSFAAVSAKEIADAANPPEPPEEPQ